jgi:hypothetical protein
MRQKQDIYWPKVMSRRRQKERMKWKETNTNEWREIIKARKTKQGNKGREKERSRIVRKEENNRMDIRTKIKLN